MNLFKQHKIKRSIALLVISLTLFSGCGLFEQEAGLDKDQNEQAQVLSRIFVTYWKGRK